MAKKDKKKYYHVSTFKGYVGVMNEGLKASEDGYIYLLDNEDVATYMARWLHEPILEPSFAVFEISSDGIHGEIEFDEGGLDLDTKYTNKYQYRVKQEVIEPKFIKGTMKHHLAFDGRTMSEVIEQTGNKNWESSNESTK